jgi:hypothetical protein
MQQVMRDSARYTSIQWLDSTKDFGTIAEGQKVQVNFRFRNTGATPLVITQVTTQLRLHHRRTATGTDRTRRGGAYQRHLQ